MTLATVKAASDAASKAPSPSADSSITHNTALTLPDTEVMALRGPWFRALVMHISMVGPGVRMSRATAAT